MSIQGTQQAHRKAHLQAPPNLPLHVCAHHWRWWRGEEHFVEARSEPKRVLVKLKKARRVLR